MNRSLFMLGMAVVVLCTAPGAVFGLKTCRSVCAGAAGAVACRAGCTVTTGMCAAQEGACVAGCAFLIFRDPRSRCENDCRRRTVEPCRRALVDSCKRRCDTSVVAPCERGCNSKLPKVCRDIMSAVPRNAYILAARHKDACKWSTVAVGTVATGAGAAIGATGGPAGAAAGAVLGASITALYPEACKAVGGAPTDFDFPDKVCRAMRF